MSKSVLKLPALASLLFVFAGAFAGNASATIYSNVPGGANTGLPFVSFGNAANPSGDSPKVGEVFSFSSASTLSSFSFYAIGNTAASFMLNIAEWNPGTNVLNQASNLVGSTLLSSSGVDTFNSVGGFTTILFDNLSLNLNAGTKYIAYLTSNDPSVTGIQLSRTQTAQDVSGFGLGLAYLSNIPGSGWQVPFNGNGFLSLQYTAVTAPAAVPEPASAALLIAGLGVIGSLSRRRNNLV